MEMIVNGIKIKRVTFSVFVTEDEADDMVAEMSDMFYNSDCVGYKITGPKISDPAFSESQNAEMQNYFTDTLAP